MKLPIISLSLLLLNCSMGWAEYQVSSSEFEDLRKYVCSGGGLGLLGWSPEQKDLYKKVCVDTK